MPPHIIRLRDKPLSGARMKAFEEAVRRSNGRIHVVVHPNSLEPKFRGSMRAGFTVPNFLAHTKKGILQKTYRPDEFWRAFADRYNPAIQRILSDDVPKIILAEGSHLDNIELRARDGWMLGLGAFTDHMGEEARGMMSGREGRSVILMVPTPDGVYKPVHDWEPLERTLAAVDVPKRLEISGTWMLTDPGTGEVLPACTTGVRDRLRKTAGRHGTISVSLNRAAGFPDVEGLEHEKHSYHKGEKGALGRRCYSLFVPHISGASPADVEQIMARARQMMTASRAPTQHHLDSPEARSFLSSTRKIKLGRNDPCWCGSGKKFKKCHGR